MILKEETIKIIRKKLSEITTFRELVYFFNFLNTVRDVDGDKFLETRRIQYKTITYYLYAKENKYRTFKLLKKGGRFREINSPDNFLKNIQRKISFLLNILFLPKEAAQGFVNTDFWDTDNRSIVTNAKKHVNKKFVYNIDIKNFFPSINYGRVMAVLQLPPFNFNEEVAHILSNLCCHGGVLPQGAPTSPVISNIVCQRLDRKLIKLGKTNRFHFSRYADDLTFSSNAYVFKSRLFEKIKSIVEEEGFQINNRKTRLIHKSQKQKVTGLVVNEKVNVSWKYIKKVRAMLHNWNVNGLKDALKTYEDKYLVEYAFSEFTRLYANKELENMVRARSIISAHENILKLKGIKAASKKFAESSYVNEFDMHIPPFKKVLKGKIDYIGMVRGKDDNVYLKLFNEYQKLTERKTTTKKVKVITEIKRKSKQDKLPSKSTKELTLHNPLKVAKLLQQFRGYNNSALRELVHPPYDPENFNLETCLKQVSKELPMRQSNKISEQYPPSIWYMILSIIKLYEEEGRILWKKHHQHPMLVDKDFAKKIIKYKRQYKVGSDDSESTSLKELIYDILQHSFYYDGKGELLNFYSKFSKKNIFFLPDNDQFIINSDFLTDVRCLKFALVKVFQSLIKHSNIDGNYNFNKEEKRIYISSTIDVNDDKYVNVIRIIDEKSIVSKAPFKKSIFGGDFRGIENNLWSLCDWNIYTKFKGKGNYKIPILPNGQKISKSPNEIQGFIHELIFYQPVE